MYGSGKDMYGSLTIPFGCVMLYNIVKLKPNVSEDDVELALGEMCNVVKDTYGNDEGGFIGGNVFRYAGFISKEGSVNSEDNQTDDHIAIVTYWNSFDQHEKSHADYIFKEKFENLAKFANETYEIGYKMMWQGAPDSDAHLPSAA